MEKWCGRLDKPRLLQSEECAAFLHGFESFGRDLDRDFLAKLGNKKSFLLEVDLAAAFARRVEFGRTDAVGISTADLRMFASYYTNSSHMFGHPSIRAR